MGINVSRHAILTDNEFLMKFVGKDHIAANDTEFWNAFLQYQITLPANSEEQLNLDSRVETLCQHFISHNLSTGNFGSLLTVFSNKVKELLELSDKNSVVHIWHTFNALFIIRCLIKYMIETGSEYQLLHHFEAIPQVQLENSVDTTKSTITASATIKQPNTDSSIINIDTIQTHGSTSSSKATPSTIDSVKHVDGSKFESFIDAVISLIVVIPVKEFTYHLHLEAVNLIIVLFSVHLFSQQSTDKSMVFKIIYKNQNANTLMSALLHFVSRMVEVPQTMFGFSSTGSIVYGIAESILSIFTFRKTHQDFENATDLPTLFKQNYPLANQSLLLILILTNHNSSKDNPYRISLFGCADSQVLVDPTKYANPITFKIDFSQLYNTLCRIVTIDQATLLLYLLLHRNQCFYKYVMAQINLQQLVVPILQTLYNAPDSTSHHIYMSLIVLLILSEDDSFNKSVHQITLKNIYWYTERSISEISLGGLLILVVIRTIQYNMLKMRDKYLHTNCLAALANMSGQFNSIHPYVAQRLVSLFETLAKKHTRLDQRLKDPALASAEVILINGGTQTTTTTATNSGMTQTIGTQTASTAINMTLGNNSDDMLQDLNVLEEVLRMVLEILNSCLSHQLVYCPNLVYTLLYKRHVFETFRSHPAFQDIIQNIDMVVGFFSSRLQRVQEQRGELGVNEVLEVISKGASQWSSDRLRKFPDLKFKYIEEDAPEEFFIPYVWTLVTKYACVHFSSESLKTITELSC